MLISFLSYLLIFRISRLRQFDRKSGFIGSAIKQVFRILVHFAWHIFSLPFCKQNDVIRQSYKLVDNSKMKQGIPRGVLHNFQYGEVHANIWGPKFYVKSIFGVCELQHG